ncbi:hypothetical protein [Sulfuriferula multivorans]|uniref:hypothetical protein n=1 Tax=Sulfuriferula multivorans TaxID=1559896 RepID=UPI000F5BCA55|nr:hypothetical protein [Sulfuriferula multivorans]
MQYINRSYCRTGSLWEGRYKSSAFGLPYHKDSHWALAVSVTKYVRRWGSGARRNGRGDLPANRINPAIRKRKPILGSEQERMDMVFKRKNKAKLTPLVPGV